MHVLVVQWEVRVGNACGEYIKKPKLLRVFYSQIATTLASTLLIERPSCDEKHKVDALPELIDDLVSILSN